MLQRVIWRVAGPRLSVTTRETAHGRGRRPQCRSTVKYGPNDHRREPAAERGGRQGGCSPSRSASPATLHTPAQPTQPLEPILISANFPYPSCPEAVHLEDLGPHVQRVRTHKKVAYTLFHVNDQMYQEWNGRGNVRCLTQTSGLSYALFYSCWFFGDT